MVVGPLLGWLLAGLGPVGLSGFCGAFVPGFRRVEGLPVAVDGCLGGIYGRFSALVGVGSGVAPNTWPWTTMTHKHLCLASIVAPQEGPLITP